jgi:hypothetical protein
MSRSASPDRVAAVDGTRRPERTASPGDAGLFLVEFSVAHAADDAAGVHHALRYAVRRLAASGTAIRWCSGLLVPAEHRFLCLVAAGSRDDVVLARDTAALPGASVHRVRPLPDRPPVPPQ